MRQTSFRRSPHVVLYWRDGTLIFENYARRAKFTAEPVTCLILHFCGQWRTLPQICEFFCAYNKASVRRSVKLLCDNAVLERSDTKLDARGSAMASWDSWNPAAGFFHFSTRDAIYANDPRAALQKFMQRTKTNPMPLPVKNYPKAPKTKLTHAVAAGEFPAILRSRRTWRLYGSQTVPVSKLAQILELTFGIQGWVDLPGLGRAAMKTSPSCGCLHPIEAYVLAQRVGGLRKGIYHYNAARHELEWLREGVTRKAIEKNLGHQWWFAKGAFLVLMTAVFSRTRWKYEDPRVYRGILIEAGHLCQTFCLSATWLGLAPFSTIAHAETAWEKWLGIDGVGESVLYVAGAGSRPKDLKHAHMGALSPRTTASPLIE